MFRLNKLTIILCVLSALSFSAKANIIDSVTVSPSQANVNQTVTITIAKLGVQSCTAVVEYGDGDQSQPFQINDAITSLTYAYSAPGVYTVLARGEGVSDGCLSPKTDQVTIVSGQPSRGITATRAPDRTIRPLPPKLGRHEDRVLKYLPSIKSYEFIPAKNNGADIIAAPGVLARGGRLDLKGVGFGDDTGVILLWGLGDPISLAVESWSDTEVRGRLPSNLDGAPRVRIPVAVAVSPSPNLISAPFALQYENPFASRMLTMNDPVVSVLSCGDDGNVNRCNQTLIEADDCFVGDPFTSGPPSPPPTIFGKHFNCGSIGDDTGTDRYRINLGNGWFIFRVVEQVVDGSSSDDTASISSIPTGGSSANIIVNWTASPGDDEIVYFVRIEALGPIGTSPF